MGGQHISPKRHSMLLDRKQEAAKTGPALKINLVGGQLSEETMASSLRNLQEICRGNRA